jgi:sialate O-acetylesterase
MEFGVGLGNDADKEIAAADYPQIRLFVVDKQISETPFTSTTGSWLPCSPDSIKHIGTWGGFSAVGYFFGRKLYQDMHVPIGLIQTSWGGTPAESWVSESALMQNLPAFNGTLSKIDAQRAGNVDAGLPAASFKPDQNSPTVLYNGMISPIIPYGIKGAIWYQGESNAGRAHQYKTLLPTLIGDWHARWGEGDFPFYIVQLAGWQPGGDSWPLLREAQWLTAKTVPNAGIATAIDIGDQSDIHPKNKQEVGRRLALVAEAKIYRFKVHDSGPVYKSQTVEGSDIRLNFDDVYGGLTAKDPNVLTGFTIAGKDLNFVAAEAKIDGDSVVVSSAKVTQPTYVRYAWSSYPDCSLFNKENLPAFPFRTDPDVEVGAIKLPANAGPNLALGKPVDASNPNKWGWDSGLVDGDWSPGAPTTWASGNDDTFPKTATIDLQTAANISLIETGVPNFGSTKTVKVSISTDGQNFTDVGTYVFSLRKEERHLFTFPAVLARYVRLTYPDHYPDTVGYDPLFVFTTEVEVYAPK